MSTLQIPEITSGGQEDNKNLLYMTHPSCCSYKYIPDKKSNSVITKECVTYIIPLSLELLAGNKQRSIYSDEVKSS